MCPLCHSSSFVDFSEEKRRKYLRCSNCHLVYVPKEFHLSSIEEKAEYDLHDNSVNDTGYRKFLSRIFEPMTKKISSDARGLEFGCGPGPALAEMFKEAGYSIELYDLYFHPNENAFANKYDFITSTEVVEHLRAPKEVLNRLWSLLNVNAWLGLMTKLVIDQESFKNWHYKNDQTHICFFSKKTFEWLASKLNAKLEFHGKDGILLQKL